jgi:hypothetical protein
MEPSEPPPSYSSATASSTSKPTHLEVPQLKTRNGIPPHIRRSMEDESRPLPKGWVRQFDAKTQHQFFVDTSSEPPRSIWHHPYDDDVYLASLSDSEREEIKGMHRVPTHADIEAESSSEEDHHEHAGKGGMVGEEVHGVHKLGRRFKDKITNSTHQEREERRRQREEEEREAYRQHLHFRSAMAKATETGVPQLLGKDRDGKDVYVEPPSYGGGYGGGFGGYSGGGYGYNPYGFGGGVGGSGGVRGGGPYADPNARFVRPQVPYDRPYGGGYGGGYGLPLLGLGGGLLLGGLLF